MGWDGYLGRPVSFSCAIFAANLIERLFTPSIPAPSLVPGSDGTLQIEWHRNRYDLEVHVHAPHRVTAVIYDLDRDQSSEIEVESDFTELANWVEKLRESRSPESVSIA